MFIIYAKKIFYNFILKQFWMYVLKINSYDKNKWMLFEKINWSYFFT